MVTMIKRGGVVFDLMKDGVVSNEALYTNLDVAPQDVITKYTTAVYEVYGPAKDAQGNPILNPSPAQLIGFSFQEIRKFFAEAMGKKRVLDAGRVAQEAEKQEVIVEAEGDLGTA